MVAVFGNFPILRKCHVLIFWLTPWTYREWESGGEPVDVGVRKSTSGGIGQRWGEKLGVHHDTGPIFEKKSRVKYIEKGTVFLI